MITLPKSHDLSHLKDSRIGNPDASPLELVTNGGFDTDSDWTKGDWTISDGFANAVNANNNLEQDIGLVIGKTYLVSFEISDITSGSIYLFVGNTSANSGSFSTNGKKYVVATSVDDSSILFNATSTLNCKLDNVSVKEWDGEELVPDPDYGFVFNDASRWVPYANNIVEQDGNAIKTTYVDNANGALNTLNGDAIEAFNLLSSGKVQFSFRAKVRTGLCYIAIWDGSNYNNIAEVTSSEWQYFTVQQEQLTSEPYVRFPSLNTAEVLWIEWLSVKKVTGLVAAYNMIPSPDGVLVDISGNGRELNYVLGINKKPISSKDGLKFTDGHLGDSTAIQQVSLSKNYTVCSRFKIEDFSRNSGVMIWSNGIDGTNRQGLNVSNLGHISYDNYNGSVYNGKRADVYAEENKWITAVCVCTSDSTSTKLYLDGEEITNVSNNGGLGGGAAGIEIGGDGSTRPLIGEIADLKFFNYAFSAEEAAEYHNSFSKLTKRGNFSDHPVGSTIG
jgi:hypothetical protein